MHVLYAHCLFTVRKKQKYEVRWLILLPRLGLREAVGLIRSPWSRAAVFRSRVICHLLSTVCGDFRYLTAASSDGLKHSALPQSAHGGGLCKI